MSVIADLRIPADQFELGRILGMETGATIELETMVPLGQTTVPFFWVYNDHRDPFEETVRKHPSVNEVRLIESHEDRTLYSIEWVLERDLVFDGIAESGAQLLGATGTASTWEFELRFPSHDALSEFKTYCDHAHIPLEVGRIYNPTKPEAGPWYGLSGPQRDTLVRAVERGYYSIPRRISTQDLADEFDVSDQAVTERLRRAIVTLVENTVIPSVEDDSQDDSHRQ